MLIKDGSKPDEMSDGHRTYSGNDFTTRHWHFGKKSEVVKEGTCLKCVFDEGDHSESCIASYNQDFMDEYFPIKGKLAARIGIIPDTKENPGVFTAEGLYTNEKLDVVLRNFEITE